MNAKQLKKLFDVYLKNKLNKTDKSLLQNWYDSFGESEQGVPGLENSSREKQLKNELLDRIQLQLNAPEKRVRKLFTFSNIAAAVAVISLGGLAALFFRADEIKNAKSTGIQFQTVETSVGQMKKVTLPDGTIVHLNANSSMKVPVAFSAKDRQFYLLEGEAFFEVAKDKQRPFIIHNQQLEVKVLGTSFNVRAYRKLADIKVSVRTGKVRVSGNGKIYGDLTPGQQITYHKSDQTAQLGSTGLTDQKAWIAGKVALENAGFDELALVMHNLYGVNLKNERANSKIYSYNLTIRSDRSLKETMRLICAIHGYHYKETGNTLTIY